MARPMAMISATMPSMRSVVLSLGGLEVAGEVLGAGDVREHPMIIERPRRRGYQLHPPDSPEAEALRTERGLTRADLDRALAELERTEGIADPDHRRHQR